MIKADEGKITFGAITLTRFGIPLDKKHKPRKMTEDEYRAAMRYTNWMSEAINWILGDLILMGETDLGEDVMLQVIADELSSMSVSQQIACQRVSCDFGFTTRVGFPDLFWTHFKTVAKSFLSPDEREELLAEAQAKGLSYRQLAELVAEIKLKKAREASPLPSGTYRVLYADPPWAYGDERQGLVGGTVKSVSNTYSAAMDHYPTMKTEQICEYADATERKIADIVQPDAVLFLWATSPKLLEALRVIDTWGFEYKTQAVWVKDKIGMGYYWRQKHELLLLATKGSPGTPNESERISSVMHAPREQHSKKPDETYGMIERMYPKAKRIELFARQARDGWDAWGNEVGVKQ